MTSRRPLTIINGSVQEIPSADQLELNSIAYSSLPTLSANDVAVVYCPDYPSGPTQLVWIGSRWVPVTQGNRSIDSYPQTGVVSNVWYACGAVNGTALNSIILVANTITAVPFVLSAEGTITNLATNVVLAATASSIMFGIYENTSAAGLIYPGLLVAPNSPLVHSSASTGVRTQPALSSLVRGKLYWAVLASSSNASIRALVPGACAALGFSSILPTAQNTCLRVARTFDNTLPASFPVGALWQTTNPPAIFYQWQ